MMIYIFNQFVLDTRQSVTTCVVIAASALTYLMIRGYHARRMFYDLRKQGMPMPPWNPILGHLLVVPPVTKTLPEDVQQPDVFEALNKGHETGDSVIYLDMWPFADPMMVVCSPVLAVEACQKHDLPKPSILHAFFSSLAGGENIFTMNGPEWKRSRALFNSAFSEGYILKQTAHIVQETEVYVEILREHARKGDMFSLDNMTCLYMMDIISVVTLDSRLHAQRQFNPLASALRRQIRWHVLDNEWNLLIRWNPARPFVQWYNSYQMNKYISHELDKRYAEWQSGESGGSTTSPRSIIHLVLASYMAQQKDKAKSTKLDGAFKKWATIQIRLFLFAGHDSTSSTICYCFYLLQSHPGAMAKLREEHDSVFGKDIKATAGKLRSSPQLVNQLPYTTAVIKESMRLFPPASAMRGGLDNVSLHGESGSYPTQGTNIWVLHSAVQRNENYWKDPLLFRPERWLVGPEDPLYPSAKGGWRPFEHGPRNCLGQTLAMLDIKITLALTAREFDIFHAYDEWDRLHPTTKVKRVNGERAYQTQAGGAHPADGFPCRIKFRE